MADTFSNYVICDDVSFKHARGVSDYTGKEFHLFYEIILYLDGDIELISETEHTRIRPNTIVAIPKETYHQFVIHGDPNKYYRCVFQFYETPESMAFLQHTLPKTIIAECDSYMLSLFEKMKALVASPQTPFAEKVINSVLVLVLDELGKVKTTNAEKVSNNRLTIDAINYITEHLTEDIKIERIAKQLNVSPSTLMHTFKSNMQTSIHKYITMKRLLLAHNKIEKGGLAHTVAFECGFNDYSGFYKQYKKMFDVPPKGKTKGK